MTISRSINVELLSHTPLAVCGKLVNTARGMNHFDDAEAQKIALEFAKKRELDVFRFSMFIFDCVVPIHAALTLNRYFVVNLQQPLDACNLVFYGCDKVELNELCEYLTTASKLIEKSKAREIVPCNMLIRCNYALNLLDLVNSREALKKDQTTRLVCNLMISKLLSTEWRRVCCELFL